MHSHDTSDTTVIGSWLQSGRLQLVAETDMLPRTFTDTDHGLLSGVKWRDIRRSLHGPLSLYPLARAMRGWQLNEVNNVQEHQF